MDDKLAGEAAKLATQAQELANNIKGVVQVQAGHRMRGHLHGLQPQAGQRLDGAGEAGGLQHLQVWDGLRICYSPR